MAATNEQVQQYVNERIRPIAENLRDALIRCQDELITIEDIYQNLSNNPTWTDERPDAPPHLLTPSDVLGIHAFVFDFVAFATGHGQLPVVKLACVREP